MTSLWPSARSRLDNAAAPPGYLVHFTTGFERAPVGRDAFRAFSLRFGGGVNAAIQKIPVVMGRADQPCAFGRAAGVR